MSFLQADARYVRRVAEGLTERGVRSMLATVQEERRGELAPAYLLVVEPSGVDDDEGALIT